MLGYGIKSSSTHTGAQRHNGKWGNPNNTLTRLLPGPSQEPSPHQRPHHKRRGAQRQYGRQGNPINLDREAEPLPWLLSGLSQQCVCICTYIHVCMCGPTRTYVLSLTFGWIRATALQRPRPRLATTTGNP